MNTDPLKALLYALNAPAAAEQASESIWCRYLIEKAGVQPAATLVATANRIEFTLRIGVDCKSRRATRDRLFTHVLEEIDQVPDRVGIAASTLNIEKMPPLDLRLARRPTAASPGLRS